MPTVFSPAWFAHHQRWLLRVLAWRITGRMARRVLAIRPHDVGYRGHIVALRPDSYTVRHADGTYTLDCRTHDKYARRLYYAFWPVWAALHAWDMLIANPLCPAWNAGFDTLTAYPAAGQGGTTSDTWCGRNTVDETFATIRSSAGNEATNDSSLYAWLQASTTLNQFVRQIRSIMTFDTSSLGAGANVSSATLSLWGQNAGPQSLGTPSLVICKATPASNGTIVAADYSQVLTASSYSTVGTVNVTNTVYTDCALNAAGISNVSLTGVSGFGATTGWDASGSFTGTWVSGGQSSYQFASSDTVGTANDPKLVITYALAGPSGLPLWLTPTYNRAVSVTTSNTINFDGSTYSATPTTLPLAADGVFVGVAGTVVLVLESGATASFTASAGQILPVKCIRVNSTSTTATSLVALYAV